MWVFTGTGFYSVVEHRDIAHHFLVRARVREDLERLLTLTHKGSSAPVYEINEVPKGDYLWSVPVHRADFVKVMVDQMMDIDYTTNVKGNIDLGEAGRHSAMLRVWTAMSTLQDSTIDTPYPDAVDWDDDFELHDAEEFVSVEPSVDKFAVCIWSAPGEPTTINTFDTEEEANEMARLVRNVAATWDGFVEPVEPEADDVR